MSLHFLNYSRYSGKVSEPSAPLSTATQENQHQVIIENPQCSPPFFTHTSHEGHFKDRWTLMFHTSTTSKSKVQFLRLM